MRQSADLIKLTENGKHLLSSIDDEHSPLRGLDMVAVFSGYMDAGNLASQIRNVLLERLESEELANFDIDRLLDYRGRRPHVTFDGERFTDYRQPALQLHLVNDQNRKPFLLLSGSEPDYQWEKFVKTIIGLTDTMDINYVCLVDAVPMPVPHTRPMGVTTHGNTEELYAGLSTWSPKAKMLAGVSQLLEIRLSEAGRSVSGYTLHVPHYLADATYPQAAVSALEYIGASLELLLPTEELREANREVEAQIAQQTHTSPEIQAMVQGLEQQFDAYAEEHGAARSLLTPQDGEELPDAEEIGAAIEDFLSSQGTDETGHNILPSRSQESEDDD